MPLDLSRQPLNTSTNFPGQNIKLPKPTINPGPDVSSRHLQVLEQGSQGEHRGRASPLGISIDTDVNTCYAPTKPKQLYPRSESRHEAENPIRESSPPKKKKGSIPAPLDLEKELSPFDRFIPIVFSNPNTPGSSGLRNRKNPQMKAVTPIVVVSPVSMSPEKKLGERQAQRPSSSIYTRAMSSVSRAGQPIPAFGKLRTPSVPEIKSPYAAAGKRPVSDAVTIFEDVPDSANSKKWLSPKPFSPGSGPRGSLDSIPATPRRSKGWWNLLSPVSPKSLSFPASAPKRSFTAPARIRRDQPNDLDKSDLPILARAAPLAGGNPRGVEDGVDWPLAEDGLARNATQRTIPNQGEAAKYYFPEFDYERPEDGVRGFGEGLSALPGDNAPGHPVTNDRGMSPTKNGSVVVPAPVSMPTYPSPKPETPTRLAAMDEDRASPVVSPPPARVGSRRVLSAATTSRDTPSSLATMSPAVVENASVAKVHRAHDIQARRYQRSPLPPVEEVSQLRSASVSSRSSRDAPARGFRDTDEDPRWKRFWAEEEPEPESKSKAFDATKHEFVDEPREEPRFYTAKQYVERDPTPPHPRRFQFEAPPKSKKNAETTKTSKKGLLLLIAIACALFFVVLIPVIVAMTVVRNHDDMPVAAQWLNLTGYPPLPTGISTVAQPNNKQTRSSCVGERTMWSCAMPKEQQHLISSNDPDQPNFRFEIRYAGDSKAMLNSTSTPLAKRDIFSDLVKTARPSPPPKPDQAFLGNTTDKNIAPFAGEDTPFIMSVLPLDDATESHISKEDGKDLSRRSTNATQQTLSRVPKPLLAMNTTVAPASLYPLPAAQPLYLFNRGKDDEHYGFYSYFDRSIFLSLSNDTLAGTDSSRDNTANAAASNTDGGAPRSQANAVCTFTETRFLVQLWTRAPGPSRLSATSLTSQSDKTASATAFDRPGSFPYAVTISLDRHGGDATKKGVFCYGLDNGGKVLTEQKVVIDENRGVGGTLVNPARGPFEKGEGGDEGRESVFGTGQRGVDGGNGGCGCSWANW